MLKEIFAIILIISLVFSNPDASNFSIVADEMPPTQFPPLDFDELLPPETPQSPIGPPNENSREFWLSSGQAILQEALTKKMNQNVAKNLIILVADGMSIPTQTAARMYMGGEEKVLSFEEFPYVGLAKTYCVNYQVPDGACTATAILSGFKTNYEVLSVSGEDLLKNCTFRDGGFRHNKMDSIFKHAQVAGKATGIVTNTRLTHATPAAAYATAASRFWENNSKTPDGCRDIAFQLVHGEIGSNLDVILGGGYREFLSSQPDPHGRIGIRTDNRDLIREWTFSKRRPMVVHDRASLNSLNVRHFDKLLGIFSESNMQFHSLNDKSVEPTLMEMAQKALQMVTRNPKGYVLFIESGRIDHAHHNNKAKLALDETSIFHEVVEWIRGQVDEKDTLIVVTADHSHTMSIGGYPKRGTDIMSLGDYSREDNMPFFTLSYANGMGFYDHFNESGRINPLDMDFNNPHFRQPTTLPLDEETHGGDDVGVFAVGPQSHLFTGVYEQHFIFHAMMYATCLGPEEFLKAPACNSANTKVSLGLISFFIVLVFVTK